MLFGALGTLISFVIISLGTAVYLVLVHTIHGFPLPLTNTPGSENSMILLFVIL